MGKSTRNKPITAEDIFANIKGVDDAFGTVTTKETSREGNINKHNYEYLDSPSYYDDVRGLSSLNANRQPISDLAARSAAQFGANVASGLGQGLANTFDLVSLAKSAKAIANGQADNFESSLFGLSTREMQEWANGVAQRNKILEREEGAFDLTDPGWWGKQIASAGTGIGMGLEAIATTAAIELSTGGLGTAAAIAKLANLGKNIVRGAKGAETLNHALAAARGMKSAATLYGVLSRSSESRMEAMGSYDEIYNELADKKNADGSDKYSEEEKRQIAGEGARRTFVGNMALLPLDILGYRTMVYNPISGAGKGIIERTLGGIGNKYARKAVAGTLFTGLEGTEEAFQFVAGQEGKHYARVLGGMDDASNFGERLGKNVQEGEFWNNFAGGVIGSPIIGGAMKILNRASNGNRTERLEQVHSDFIKNIAQMDETFSSKIKELQSQGKDREAGILRRQFSANKALSALHLDAMTDKDSAFEAHNTFISGVLGEINEGKTDALGDLGFTNPTPEQVSIVKEEFTNYLQDATELKAIYDDVKYKYNKNFVPEIANDQFQLNKLLKEKANLQTTLATKQAGLSQFSQLSPTGQEIYNTEYKLKSYELEKARLNKLLKKAKTDHEKEDIKALIKATEERQQGTTTRFNALQGAEEYTQQAKTLDNDIIGSALRSPEYAQFNYENERLDNEIALKRKELARWNNPEFVAEKNRESIKKAKSVVHVDATREELDKTGQNTAETEEALQDKEAELAANRAADIIKDEKKAPNGSKSVPGNSNLFGDEEATQALSDIKSTVLTGNSSDDDILSNKEEETYLLSPSEYDFDKTSDEAKAKITGAVKRLLDRMPDTPSFEGLVREVIKAQGEAVADDIYNAIKYGWEANGMQPVNYDAIYDKIFNDPIGDLVLGAKSSIKTEKQLAQATDKTEKEELSHQAEPEGFDTDNQPIYVYKGIVTNESSPKFAFVTRLAELKVTNEEEAIAVEHEYTEDELNTGDYVNSLPLLDPDRFNENEELQVRVPPNYLNIKIPVYNTDGTKGQSVTFGQYVAQKGLTPDSQEYKDKIPMIMYAKGVPTDANGVEKGVAFVHDIGWYHPLRFNQEHKDDMANAIKETRNIRQAVLSGGNKADIVITGKRQTTFAGLKSKPMPLREANPETKITVALSRNSLSVAKGQKAFPNENEVLINVKDFSLGEVLDVRRFGNKDGKKTFIANKVWKPKLDEASKDTVLLAINIYANRNSKNPAIREKHDAVIKQIKDTMGIDITNSSESGLQRYLEHFILVHGERSKSKNDEVEARMKATLTPGTPYIAFIAGGNIVFGRAGEPISFNSQTNKDINSFFINPNAATPSTQALSALAKPNIIGWYEQNVNVDNLALNKPIITINKDLSVSQTSPTYNDHLLDRLTSDIKSHNIGTPENPKYVTNVQPVITYALKTSLTTEVPTNEEIKATIEETFRDQTDSKEATKPETQTTIQSKKDALDRARGILGRNRGIGNDALLSPAELDINARDEVSKDINRIAGLTPDQQFQVVDFMYNQIVPMIKPGTFMPRNQVYKAVDDALDAIFKPLQEGYKNEIEELTKLIDYENPTQDDKELILVVADFKALSDKIDAIYANLDVFKEETKIRLDKYSGITEDKEETKLYDGEDVDDYTVEDEGNEREIDFWTDILTESPENKLSYAMRRFFGQIRQYDPKTKQPITGFLNLPTYVGADSVTRTLMVTLADVPSNFDAMIARLEKRVDAIPWMQEAIDRLKAADVQKRNQFVTVMSNHSLRMKFTMISYNRKTESWTTKVYETNKTGVAATIENDWNDNLYNSDLVEAKEDGTYSLNIQEAKNLMQIFESWKGLDLNKLDNISSLEAVRKNVKPTNPVVFTPTDVALLNELKTKLVDNSDRVVFSLKGYDYQVSKAGDGKYVAEFLKKSTATKEQIDLWLRAFGITLSDGTLDELMTKGLMHNKEQRSFNDLFETGTNTNGLFAILYNNLKTTVESTTPTVFEEGGNNPLQGSVVKSLANLEADYNDVAVPFGFRDGSKSIFALTAPKFSTDRARDLKSEDDNVRRQLESVSFSKPSFWLRMLKDPDFRNKFHISHMGLTAFKELGKKLYRDNSLAKLSDLDHEITKLGMFWDMQQGQARVEGLPVYPDTSIALRMATMFSPTMSDKHMMTTLTTAVLDLQNKDLLDGETISDEVTRVLFDQIVRPELLRMISHARIMKDKGGTNVSNYDKGAGMFLMLPALNNLKYNNEVTLVNAIKHQPDVFTINEIENNKTLMESIHTELKQYVKKLTDEKLEVWKDNGLLVYNKQGELAQLKFFDKAYLDKKFRGNNQQRAKMAAMDFVVNSLIANSNSFMVFAGDPALYFKSKETDPILAAKQTFVNVGKRLANQIAPGTTLANSETEKYIQVFVNDRESVAENIEYLEEILGKEGAAAYRKLEGSDAQEYTTWKEHLDILVKLGKTADSLLDISAEEIQEARDLFSSDVTRANLTPKQKELIGKVMQPMKPVYTGQIHDAAQDLMRTVYIKSSSFPLIPQLTAGMEIDKLRVAIEKLEKSKKMNVRISYQTANKVGSHSNPASIWKEDGNMIDDIDSLDLMAHSLELDRKNFRIQQEVPFKSDKQGDDKITLGTQIMKLLFGDGMLNVNGFEFDGKEYNGKDLHKIYNDKFIDLVQEKRKQLFDELGLDSKGVPIDRKKSMTKLQAILKEEAIKRGYPLQDIQGLTLNEDGQFNLPLWSSANSNRYESMLNAIVSNRLIRIKFPGASYVVGSEEGFRTQENLEGIDQSKIIFTSAWNGSHLEGSKHANGKWKKAQVLVASKFKNADGILVDLFQKEGNEYKYITKTDAGFRLKEDMFDADLLNMSSFRIPSSGHQSASQVEIVGFLPHTSADLMIVPAGFTKQKGLDFDIDKENTYHLWTHMTPEGKFEVLQEKHRDAILLAADKLMRDEGIKSLAGKLKNAQTDTEKTKITRDIKAKMAENKLFSAFIESGVSYDAEDIASEKFLTTTSSKINEKLIQNDIIKIHNSVLSNPAKEVQAKVTRVLTTKFAEKQADFIESISNSANSDYWTPLSDEYQKSKMALGASGKIGTGAYSLDVVFHSLAQQAALNGKPIELVEVIGKGEDARKVPKTWRFGDITSNSQLGAINTVDGSRSISELQAERQNIAVDNEKLQVMGRVGLDDSTLDVDKVFNMVGLDKGKDGNSIAMLFLSQPIVKAYVAKMKNAFSNVSDFDSNKKATILLELQNQFDPERKYAQFLTDNENTYVDQASDMMTNDAMVMAIQSASQGISPNPVLQMAILDRFLEMSDYGIAIRGIQVTINTDSKGLGKSFFDVIEKKNALNRLGMDTNLITGASGLIGDYMKNDNMAEDEDTEGYINIGDWLVKPNTLTGAFNIMGVATAYDMWSDHFPYDYKVTNIAFDEIIKIIGKDDMSDTKTITLKQNIFQNMRKYFAASKYNGIIQGHDDINAERRRLFIDSDDNVSLARYVKELKQMKNNPVVDAYIKTNKLIGRFEFDIQKNGRPSLIKFNNAAGEEFDEQYLYESLAILIEPKGKDGKIELPKIGNKQYTLDTLAQDLIAYSYLGNAIQEAIQFTKYVPINYLNVVGYSGKMRTASNWLDTNLDVLGAKIKSENEQHFVSEFTMQYIQHNPERVAPPWKWDTKSLEVNTIKIDDKSFYLKGEARPTFISVYDATIPKGEKKFKLYWFDGAKYINIPVLGILGMDEYQKNSGIGTSIVNDRIKIENASPQASSNEAIQQDPTEYFKLNSGTTKEIYQSIADTNVTYGPLVKRLLPFVENDLLIATGDIKPRGIYVPETHKIIIGKKITSDANVLADTLAHELVHALTYKHIDKYIATTESGEVVVTGDAPGHISNLARLYNGIRNTVDQTELERVVKQARDSGVLNPADRGQYYGLTTIHEFMTMALTNKAFQDYLNKIPYKGTGQSFLDKFKEFVFDVLKSLGVKFDPDFTAAHAISNIFEVIEQENKNDFNPYQQFYDDSINTDNFDEFLDDDGIASPSEFPNKQLTIVEENCL